MKYSVIQVRKYNLKKKRESLGISGREFAKMVGIDYAHLCRLENDFYVAKEDTYKRIKACIDNLNIK